jgi:ssDNA-binding Zn-finger/Zn-ribbon topoisomerase 1
MKPENVTCPDCGGAMVSRVSGKDQRRFWGCRDFPRCRGTRDTDGLSRAERGPRRDPDDETRPIDRDKRRWEHEGR